MDNFQKINLVRTLRETILVETIKTENLTDSQTNIEEVLRRISLGGLTLIEVMVVIVIIGILSALAVPKMLSISAQAKTAETSNVITEWDNFVSIYTAATDIYGHTAPIGVCAATYAKNY